MKTKLEVSKMVKKEKNGKDTCKWSSTAVLFFVSVFVHCSFAIIKICNNWNLQSKKFV